MIAVIAVLAVVLTGKGEKTQAKGGLPPGLPGALPPGLSGLPGLPGGRMPGLPGLPGLPKGPKK